LVDRDLLAEDYVAVGLSDGDAAVLRATIDSTSYEYPCSQEGATSKYQRTVKGVPQGGKESAILSLFPMQRIMSRAKQLRREARATQGLTHTSLEVLSRPSNDVPRFPLVHADLPADCESWDVEDAAYADDVATLVQDPDANIPLVASTFCQALLENKQEPNLDKSEILRRYNGAGSRQHQHNAVDIYRIQGHNQGIPVLEEVKYLGDHVTANGTMHAEIVYRVKQARGAYQQLQARIWKNRRLPHRLLHLFYVSLVQVHLVGAMEAYVFTAADAKQLEVAQNNLLWRMYKAWHDSRSLPIDKQHRPSTADLRQWLHVDTIQSKLRMLRVRWVVKLWKQGPLHIWKLINGIFNFEAEAPRTPWHSQWDLDLRIWRFKHGIDGEFGGEREGFCTDTLDRLIQGPSMSWHCNLYENTKCLCTPWAPPELERPIQCEQCAACFLDHRWLNFHKRRAHGSVDVECHPEDVLLVDLPVPKCPFCCVKMASRQSLLQHMRQRKVCGDNLIWMWQQKNAGHEDIPWPLTRPSGQALAASQRSLQANRWRSMQLSVLCRNLKLAAQQQLH
jgi:hypothetical protein